MNTDTHAHVAAGGFVLRRTDRAPEIPMMVAGYDETVQSSAVEHPDGVLAPTILLRSPGNRERQLRLGWLDVTAMWTGEAPVRKQRKASRATPTTTAKPKPKATSKRRAVRRVTAGD